MTPANPFNHYLKFTCSGVPNPIIYRVTEETSEAVVRRFESLDADDLKFCIDFKTLAGRLVAVMPHHILTCHVLRDMDPPRLEAEAEFDLILHVSGVADSLCFSDTDAEELECMAGVLIGGAFECQPFITVTHHDGEVLFVKAERVMLMESRDCHLELKDESADLEASPEDASRSGAQQGDLAHLKIRSATQNVLGDAASLRSEIVTMEEQRDLLERELDGAMAALTAARENMAVAGGTKALDALTAAQARATTITEVVATLKARIEAKGAELQAAERVEGREARLAHLCELATIGNSNLREYVALREELNDLLRPYAERLNALWGQMTAARTSFIAAANVFTPSFDLHSGDSRGRAAFLDELRRRGADLKAVSLENFGGRSAIDESFDFSVNPFGYAMSVAQRAIHDEQARLAGEAGEDNYEPMRTRQDASRASL